MMIPDDAMTVTIRLTLLDPEPSFTDNVTVFGPAVE
jgi:hypothetical protein